MLPQKIFCCFSGLTQWYRKQFESGRAKFAIFLLCPFIFAWCPKRDRRYRKVQGHSNKNWSRAQTGGRTRSVRSLTFQGYPMSKLTSPTDRAWELEWFHVHVGPPLTLTAYHAAFPRYCMSILEHILANLGDLGHTLTDGWKWKPFTWRNVDPLLTRGYSCRGKVCTKNQLDRPSRLITTQSRPRQTDDVTMTI